ncbi:facilitated trehalose transporter Tret1-like [Aricia agestis]|uniref:facilitated trehalose transporter Tret1-like n=1 Tax=Aricia agestis TaxID=91739 RepID=UPI001C209F44|nr:facilitated trehalose transporter Tret1-like [Aricia agestis]
MKPIYRQCFVTATACFNVIGLGCVVGFPAILLPQLREGNALFHISRDTESWIAATFPLASLLGNLLTPLVMERFGRKPASLTMALLMTIGWFLIMLAPNVEVLLLGRVFHGVSCGFLNLLRSILVGEYTSPENRGAFLMVVSLCQSFGVFIVHLIGSLFSWQRTALVSVFFAFASFVLAIYMPESPSWLLAKGRLEEFRRVFLWLRGPKGNDELESMIKAKLALEAAEMQDNHGKGLKKALWIVRQTEFYKPILIVISFNVMMHMAGGTTMANYSMSVLTGLMGAGANAYFWMVFLDSQRIVSNAIAVYIIKRVKRRVMVFGTTLLCIVSQAAIAIYSFWISSTGVYSNIWIPVVLVNLQMLSVAMGMVPMPSVITGEVFPLAYRGIAGMISVQSGSLFMFAILKTFPLLLDTIGIHGTYGLYSLLLSANMLYLWFALPETKGKTLQEIEDEFRGNKSNSEEVEASKYIQAENKDNQNTKQTIQKSNETNQNSNDKIQNLNNTNQNANKKIQDSNEIIQDNNQT